MPRLSRVRLVSIGHAHARFGDVTLDFRDGNGRATDSTIWLRNGGGKSTLVSLLFALVRVHQQDFLGGKADAKRRRLADYVLARDHAVVAAEWELDGSNGEPPPRLVIGTFFEWRGGAGDEANLRRLFFSCRVADDEPALTLDGLPLYVDRGAGQPRARRSQTAFAEEWSELRARHPHRHVYAETVQKSWTAFLESVGIDPELFKYQLRMNQREGGADELFRFADHEAFIGFLLELAFDPARADEVSRNIALYRTQLRRRTEEYLPERALVAGLEQKMAPLVALSVRRGDLGHDLAASRHRLQQLRQHVGARSTACAQAAAEHERSRDDARQRAIAAAEAASRARQRAAQLRWFAAQRSHEKAVADLDSLRLRHRELDLQAKLWDAAAPLQRARRIRHKANGYRRELEQKQAEHAPLSTRLKAAATRLAAALLFAVEGLRERDVELIDLRRGADEDAREHRAQQGRLLAAISATEQRLDELHRRLAEAAGERVRLEGDQVLLAGESGSAALARLDRAIAEHAERKTVLSHRQSELRQRALGLRETADEAAQEVGLTQARHEKERERWEVATTERQSLEADPVLRRELECAVLDLERLPEAELNRLAEAGHRALDEIARLGLERAAGERDLRHLEHHGLLPPTIDAERVLEALRARLPATWSGWEYIVANVPAAERRALVAAVPDLALGVVVRDVDFDKARDILADSALDCDLPVVVARSGAFADAPAPRGFVVGPADARIDRAAAAGERARRDARRTALDTDIAAIERRHSELSESYARLREFRRQYPRGWFTEQALRLDEHAETGRLARARVARVREEEQLLRKEVAELDHSLSLLASALLTDERRRTDAAAFVRTHEAPLALAHEQCRQHEGALARDRQECDQHRHRADTASERAARAEEERRPVGAQIALTQKELDGVGYLDAPAAAALGNLGDLREAYAQLRTFYEKEVGADWLQQAIDDQDAAYAAERSLLQRKLVSASLREEPVAQILDQLPPELEVDERRDTAANEAASAFGAVGNQGGVVQRRAEDVERERKRCDALGVAAELGGSPPSGPAQAELEATLADEEAGRAEALAAAAESSSDRAEAERRQADHAATVLEGHARRLASLERVHADALAVAADDDRDTNATPADERIADELEAVDQRLAELSRVGQLLNQERQRAAHAVRAVAGDDTLSSPVARKFREADDETLEVHAGDFVAQLQVRRQILDQSIADVDKHRDLLVTKALDVAQEGMQLLHAAARQSRLPDHLGGGQFLRIDTHEPDDPGERRGRIGELVDEMAGAGEIPTGITLVQRAVRRLVRPARVRVMFPDPGRGQETVDIVDMARFSGGEQLTCAILLYCTLAQLRARTRGQSRRSSSVLVLDNPIGRASRTSFLELQRDVARSMGVQLLYTTGVNDYEALHVLPNVIRLRNERVDRNSGHQVVEAEAHVLAARIGREESPREPSGVD